MNIKNVITSNIKNLPGWKTKRRILVIESDDWGSIRMPSKEIYKYLLKKGEKVDQDPYSKYDSLASEMDLVMLFEELSKFKDQNNNSPVITANVIMANPDFDAIKKSNFSEYHYELFTETLKYYPYHSNSFSLLEEGIRKKLFYPQLHGREHINVSKWMTALKNGNPHLLMAFNNRMLTLPSISMPENMNAFMDAFEFDSKKEIFNHSEIIKDASNLFKKVFGFESKSIMVPCYIWSRVHEPMLKSNNIEYIQGFPYQYEPLPITGTLKYKKIFHYTGEKNNIGQRYLVRNAFFEPSQNPATDIVGECLKKIEIAYKWHKPAIIGSHRLNFIGYIDPLNRKQNLKLLNQLLFEIIKRWPDVEFMSSDQLGDLINQTS